MGNCHVSENRRRWNGGYAAAVLPDAGLFDGDRTRRCGLMLRSPAPERRLPARHPLLPADTTFGLAVSPSDGRRRLLLQYVRVCSVAGWRSRCAAVERSADDDGQRRTRSIHRTADVIVQSQSSPSRPVSY